MRKRVDPDKIIETVCRGSNTVAAIRSIGRNLDRVGIAAAVKRHQTSALFDWLIGMFSYQGVSDQAAASYIANHGNVTYSAVTTALASSSCNCTKLAGFSNYHHCHYAKSRRRCAEPDLISSCPVPTHDLRKGDLNQLAYSLYFFLRDVCDGDLVGFIDRTLTVADRPGHPDRVAMMREALFSPLKEIYGVSNKVLNLAFANLLLAADPTRVRWVEVGASMITVDRLIYNFLHRTGILEHWGSSHQFGPACYRSGGCAPIIDRAARRLDAREFYPTFPPYFPHFIEYSLWAFCAQQELDICNGNRIDDTSRCGQSECPVFPICGRIRLSPAVTDKKTPESARAPD